MAHIRSALLILFLLLMRITAMADHVVGGELLYTHLSGNDYKITLIMYAECSGGRYPYMANATPKIKIFNSSGGIHNITLQEEVNLREDISNVCPAEANNTTCKNPTGTIPGITKFTYSAQAVLPADKNWQFLFTGQMDNSGVSQSGVSHYISNISNNTGYGVHLYLRAMLNNSKRHNSSPAYTANPTPFYCVNIPQEYNQGIADDDLDELRFRLIPPVDINGIETVYNNPYSHLYPFATKSGQLRFDSLSGQMSFTPVKAEVVFIATRAEEYREGELVGTSMRGMTFFMNANCNNEAPYGSIDPPSVQGGILNNNTINICDNEQHVSFSIPAGDHEGDPIQVALSNVPNGASTNITNNNTPKPVIQFDWDMHGVVPGRYTFFVTYNDKHCPIPGNQVIAYTVNLAEPFSIFHEVLTPTNCKYKQFVQFHVSGGILPRKIEVSDAAGNRVASYVDYNYELKDSFAVGDYHVELYSDELDCTKEYDFAVRDYGIYPDAPAFDDIHQCLNDDVNTLNPIPADGGIVHWYDTLGNLLELPPSYTTDSVRTYRWLVNQTVKVCPSVFDTFDVGVHAYPDITILNEGGHACVGDGIYLQATGGARYEWQPEERITYHDGKPYTVVNESSAYIVTGYNEYECSTKDTITFDEIEPCCLFSYPNAFTPNRDGINDGWRPVTYGNVEYYLLSVYDRWGQRVFITSDPREQWDGSANSKPCELGTYHYYLRAKCVTGKEEKSSGSFTLLR